MLNPGSTNGRSRRAPQRFAKDRFVVLKAPFPQVTDAIRRHVAALDLRAAEILEHCDHSAQIVGEFVKASPLELIVVPEQSAPQMICRYEYILGASDQLRELERQHIRPLVETVVGRSLSLFKDKMNRKSAGGGAFEPHQDHEAYRQFPPRWYVTTMIANR